MVPLNESTSFIRLLLLLTFASSVGAAFADNEHRVTLFESQAAFRFGDNLDWASPELDDSQWQRIEIPSGWARRLDPMCRQRSGWYRLRFQLAKHQDRRRIAICVGVVSDACEVFVDGVKVGGSGSMYPHFDGVPNDPLVIDLPDSIVASADELLVAVRVHRSIYGGGIVRGPIAIGDAAAIRDLAAGKLLIACVLEGFVLSLLLIPIVFGVVSWYAGEEREYTFLALSAAATFVMLLLESRLFLSLVGFSSLRQNVYLVAASSLLPLFHLFIAKLFYRPVGRKTIVGLTVCSIVIIAAIKAPATLSLGAWLWLIELVFLGACWIAWTVQSMRQRRPDAGLICAGLSLLLFFALAESFELFGSGEIMTLRFSALGVACFLVFQTLVLFRRYHRARRQLHQATAAILTAHEDERRRIGRDLHDGVTQSLMAIQLNLQMLQAGGGQQSDGLSRTIDEVKSTSEEVRRLSHDLRPEVLEHLEMADAIESHASEVRRRTSIEIDVSADRSVSLSEKMKDNLYRVFQECIQNAVKHAEATRVEVNFRLSDGFAVMEVSDDGRGLPDRETPGRRGVGLITIRERAQLLGGTAEFSGAPGGGTCIAIRVPIEGMTS